MIKYYFSLLLVIQSFCFPLISSSSNQKNYIKALHKDFLHYKYISSDNWANYGPLEINTFSLRIKKNNQIYQAYNSQSKPIYIAINCINKMINVTNHRLDWKGWKAPLRAFEFRILNDLCRIN